MKHNNHLSKVFTLFTLLVISLSYAKSLSRSEPLQNPSKKSTATTCLSDYGYAYFFRWSSYAQVSTCGWVPQTAFTYSLWLKPYTIAEDLGIIGTLVNIDTHGNVYYRNSALRVLNSQITLVVAIGDDLVPTVSYPIKPAIWTHVAVTYLSSEKSGTAKMYINGQLVANMSNIGTINSETSACVLRIARDGVDDYLYVGQIDEIQVWSRALSSSEILLRYKSQLTGSEPSLVLYLVGDGDNMTNAIDHSSSSHVVNAIAGSRYEGLNFFSWIPDCVGCFTDVYPRCAPWNTVSDLCGDRQITGAEQCEQGDKECDSECKCPPGHIPSISAGGCILDNSTCTVDMINVCSNAASCGTDCSCILRDGLGCLSNFQCSLYDMPMIGTMAWTVCFTACSDSIVSSCFANTPESCLIYRNKTECDTHSNTGCIWCTDFCADNRAQCMEMCGNGFIESINGETCDDGNFASGDGCAANCKNEEGWNCTSGTCIPVCGDSKIFIGEECDDGNSQSGDGCNSSCLIESGWTCNTTVFPTVCSRPSGLPTGAIVGIAVGVGVFILLIAIVLPLAIVFGRKKPKRGGENKPIEHTVTAVIIPEGGISPGFGNNNASPPQTAGMIPLDPFPQQDPNLQQQQMMMLDQQQAAMFSSPFPQQQMAQPGLASFGGWGDQQQQTHDGGQINPPNMSMEM